MGEDTIIKFKKPNKSEKGRERVPCLAVVEGNDIGEIFRVEKNSVVLGRSDKADIVLQDEGISRQHARIDKQDDGYMLNDLESTNGTYVNGEQIQQTGLHDGDKIRLGEVLLRFAYQDSIDVQYQENLRTLAMRDGLTKIFNRRYFLEMLSREYAYAQRQRMPLTLILFDIDHFKTINDTHGHSAGDQVLKVLAAAITEEVRGYDVFARYGGEEFVVLLRSTALDNALIFAERIRVVVEELATEYENKRIPITISLGVASLDPDHARTAEDLIKEADRYLYEAKNHGRNRVSSTRD